MVSKCQNWHIYPFSTYFGNCNFLFCFKGCFKLHTGYSNVRTPYIFPYKIEIIHLMRLLWPVDCHNIYCRGVYMSKMTFYAFFVHFWAIVSFLAEITYQFHLTSDTQYLNMVSEVRYLPVRQDNIIIGQDYIILCMCQIPQWYLPGSARET